MVVSRRVRLFGARCLRNCLPDRGCGDNPEHGLRGYISSANALLPQREQGRKSASAMDEPWTKSTTADEIAVAIL